MASKYGPEWQSNSIHFRVVTIVSSYRSTVAEEDIIYENNDYIYFDFEQVAKTRDGIARQVTLSVDHQWTTIGSRLQCNMVGEIESIRR